MIRLVRHPFVERDLIGIARHIVEVTNGNTDAARRRLDDVDEMLLSIIDNPTSGVRLGGRLGGWLVRHGGAGHRVTIVFRPDLDREILYVALIAFGGRNWMKLAAERKAFASP